jgi:ABC-2 type transport system permease protein
MLTVFMTILPSVFLSGFIYPLQALPIVLQWISYAIPLRYFLVIIRALMIKGVGLEAILPDVIALTIFGVVIMGAAALRFRKRLD